MSQKLTVGVYVREHSVEFTQIDETVIPIVTWYGPYRTITEATDAIVRMNGLKVKEGVYEIHDFT